MKRNGIQLSSLLRKAALSLLGLTIFVVPLSYSFSTYQVFEINKFSVFIFGNSILLILFGLFILTRGGGTKDYDFSRQNTIPLTIFLLFLFSSLISGFFGHSLSRSFWGSGIRHFGIFLHVHFFLLVVVLSSMKLNEREQKAFLFFPIIASGLIQTIIAFVQFIFPDLLFTGLETEMFLGRAFGTLGQPNFLAQYLISPIIILFAFMMRKRRSGKSWILSSLVFFLMITGLALTGSRAGGVGAIAGLVVFLLVERKRKKRIPARFAPSTVPLFFLSFSLLFLLVSRFIPSDGEFSTDRSRSISTRIAIWREIPRVVAHHPFFGYGMENFPTAFSPRMPSSLIRLEDYHSVPDRSHNYFFDLLVMNGTIGLFLFLSFIGTVCSQMDFSRMNTHDAISFSAVIGIFASWLFGFPVIADSFLFYLFLTIILTSDDSPQEGIRLHRMTGSALIIFAVISMIWTGLLWTNERNLLVGIEGDTSLLVTGARAFPWEERTVFAASENLLKEGSLSEARGLIEQFLDLNPHSGEGWTHLGSIATAENDFITAESSFDRASLLSPMDPGLWRSWTKMKRITGDLESAKEKLEHLLEISPEYWRMTPAERIQSEPYRLFFKHNPDFWGVIKDIGEIEHLLGNEDKGDFYCDRVPPESGFACGLP